MNARQELCESLRDWLLALALAGSLILCYGSACGADAAESAEAMEVDAEAAQEAPDGTAARLSLEAQRQQRQALREGQRQARSERLEAQMQRGARTVAPLRTAAAAPPPVVAASPSAAVAMAVAEPAAAVIAAPQVDIVFRRDEAWGPDFASVREGSVVVEAQAIGRDAAGQAVDIDPAWEAADPAAVAVSPALGKTVTITVLAPGESNLTVVGPGYSRDLWISATAQGKAMQVRISQ